jgi:hypothetical protein
MSIKFARHFSLGTYNPVFMEPLFTADIIVNGNYKLYHVFFHDEEYHFEPEDGTGEAFHIKRENDEWKVAGSLAEIAQQQAVSALEHYLLSQH